MALRRWTILVVPQGTGSTRQVQLSARVLKVLTGMAVMFAVAMVGLTYTAISKALDLSHLDRLERRNQALAAELSQMQGLVGVLSDTVSAITNRDRRIRLLAGLNPQDPDVMQAGVGGPAGPATATDLLLAETALGRLTLGARDDLETLNRRAAMLAVSYQEAIDTLGYHVDRLTRTPSIRPTDGFVSSRFNRERLHPIFNEVRAHEGTDFVAPLGAPIFATAAGRVVRVGRGTGYGLFVVIDHGDGIQTLYAHCSRILVNQGQSIARGAEIAEVGRTGTVTNPHVHYEVLVNGKPQDPFNFIFSKGIVD